MKSNFYILSLLCILSVQLHAQYDYAPSLKIGDAAPPLRTLKWLKGTPIQRFEKGMVYVVEFGTTWCKPCRAALPHLSALARQYRDSVTIIDIDVFNWETISMQQVKHIVDSIGEGKDYCVAAQDSNMVAAWRNASGEQTTGIPISFVVDADGRLAWIGHPKDIKNIIFKIVHNTWNLQEALATRNLNKRLQYLDNEASYDLMQYNGDPYRPDDNGKPDSALLFINELVKKDPGLKYAPVIAVNTFSALLKTDPQKAYEYGKIAIVTRTYDDPAASFIVDQIDLYSGKADLPAIIYQLGAEACQVEIDQMPYPELVDISKYYHKMARWLWLANNKSKAIEAELAAIESLKTKKDYSPVKMTFFKSTLRKYMNM